MTDYAIGDIQGCYGPLRRLMDRLAFDPARDCLWVAGDIINRGPDSLASLRFIRDLGPAVRVVLGNHDLHLLAVALGGHEPRAKDTLAAILEAPDRDELLDWLRHCAIACYDESRDLFMAHAGLPHIWSVPRALELARELESVIRGPRARDYFRAMYGNTPEVWSDALEGLDRWRMITNYYTRMRFVDEAGRLDLTAKEGPESAPENFRPWFEWPRQDRTRVVFGHWAALGGQTGSERYIGLDTGCVWGGQLTAMNLDTHERIACDCN